MILIYILLFACVLVLLLPGLRRRLITKSLMSWFIRSMPTISKTEAEALAAGDAWVEADIFQGKLDWHKLNKLKLSHLSLEEQEFLDNDTTKLCELINDWQVVNQDHDLSKEAWQYIKDQGFCGLTLAREYGGKGFSAAAVSAIVTKIASHSFTAGVTVMVPNSLGLGELFSHFGTMAQRQQFLPDLALGRQLACFALTSPEAGSDASSITDTGIVCYQEFMGEKCLGVKVNFNKRYITLAPIATLVGLAFRLSDPDKLLGGVGEEGITCCYIPRDHPGLSIGKRHYPCGMPIMNGPIQGKDVFIPLEWIIGGQEMAGKGWSILMSALSTGRAISLPAISQGITTKHYISSSAYVNVRVQFGQAIGQFEGVQEVLARIAGFTYMAESCRALTYTALDNGVKPAVASAITKYHTTELGRKIINDALDLHGGKGVMDGPKNYLTSHYRGLLISITGEGANIMTRNLIIFGQAMTRCHPYLSELMKSAKANDIRSFDKAISRSVWYTACNIVSLAFNLITFRRLIKTNIMLKDYSRELSFLSKVFAVSSDMTILVYGGKLKHRERICATLADMLSYLYLGVATIKYYTEHHVAKEEISHAKWAVEYSLYQFQESYFELLANFSNQSLAKILRLISFPLGKRFKKPNHVLESKLATDMQTHSLLREHFKKHVYLDTSNIGVVEDAFMMQIDVATIKQKLDTAIKKKQINRKLDIHGQLAQALETKILSQDEVNSFLEFWNKYYQAISVNAFDKTLVTPDQTY